MENHNEMSKERDCLELSKIFINDELTIYICPYTLGFRNHKDKQACRVKDELVL